MGITFLSLAFNPLHLIPFSVLLTVVLGLMGSFQFMVSQIETSKKTLDKHVRTVMRYDHMWCQDQSTEVEGSTKVQ